MTGQAADDVSAERLQALSIDKRFIKNLRQTEADLADYLTGDLWYQGYAAENPAAPVSIGYFSPEFGITEVLRSTRVAWASLPVTT